MSGTSQETAANVFDFEDGRRRRETRADALAHVHQGIVRDALRRELARQAAWRESCDRSDCLGPACGACD